MVDVSTNFYIRRTKPILCFPEFHLAKRSAGWKPLHQANFYAEDGFSFETERPVIESREDIKRYVDSGEWEIVDEYGTEYTYDEFLVYLDDNFEYETDETRETHMSTGIGCYLALDGTEWTETDFR